MNLLLNNHLFNCFKVKIIIDFDFCYFYKLSFNFILMNIEKHLNPVRNYHNHSIFYRNIKAFINLIQNG